MKNESGILGMQVHTVHDDVCKQEHIHKEEKLEGRMKTLKIEAQSPQCSPMAETPFHVVPPATSVCWLTHNSMEPTRKGPLSLLPNPPQFSAYPPYSLTHDPCRCQRKSVYY